MKQELFTILENNPIARDVYRLILKGNTDAITAPGQFVNIKIDGLYLRRPISVCDWEDGKLTLIYKVVGAGTKLMAQMKSGDVLDILTGLGNGFTVSDVAKSALLVGGGVGTPPMYGLARVLREKGWKVTVCLGFGGKPDVFYLDEFKSLGAHVICATMDGSCGENGTVIDALRKYQPEFDCTFACGPIPMLHALYDYTDVPGQYSFEERMGCGFGACMGCTCHTKNGNKRICKDGPVLDREEIVWRT